MKLLVLALNYAPEPVGAGRYTSDMARWLAKAGHEVTVVCAQPYYPQWRIARGFRQHYSASIEDGVRVIRCPLYVPKNPSGSRRMVHYVSFALSVVAPTLFMALRMRPDIVFTTAPSLIAAPVARLAALISGARSWLHVHDLEVDAAFATGLLHGSGLVARVAKRFEKVVIGSFERVSSVSAPMCQRIGAIATPHERVVVFPNGIDIDAVKPLERPSFYRDRWKIGTPHVALYSGNIANKQGLEIVLEAARRLRHRTDLTFVICGNGPNRAKLEREAGDLANLVFHDLQLEPELNELLNLATIHLLPQLAGAADLVLPSKLGNMLASGRPIVATVAPGTGIALEIGGCGLATPPGDATALADALERLIDDPAHHARMSVAARRRAKQNWSREQILSRQLAEFDKLLGQGAANEAPVPAAAE